MFVVQVPSWVEARSSVSPPKTRSMSVVSSENTPGVDELLWKYRGADKLLRNTFSAQTANSSAPLKLKPVFSNFYFVRSYFSALLVMT